MVNGRTAILHFAQCHQQRSRHQLQAEYLQRRRLHHFGLPAEAALDPFVLTAPDVAMLRIAGNQQLATGVGPDFINRTGAVLIEEHTGPVALGLLAPGLDTVLALALKSRDVELHAGSAQMVDQQRRLLRPDFHRSAAAMAAAAAASDGFEAWQSPIVFDQRIHLLVRRARECQRLFCERGTETRDMTLVESAQIGHLAQPLRCAVPRIITGFSHCCPVPPGHR